MKPSSAISPLSSQGGHSALVSMQLLVNGFTLPISQLGPDFLVIDTPLNQSPATATVVMRVDESERRWNVRLPNGISAGSKRVQITAVT